MGDDLGSQPPMEALQILGRKDLILEACRSGHLRILCSVLNVIPRPDRPQFIEYELCLQNGVRHTPLIIAILNGHSHTVKALIEQFHADYEHAGNILFDGFLIKEASPLWCAAATGKLNIVKILVRCGASVNSLTSSLSTPIRAACYDGRIDIISYLVRHGADPISINLYSNNCLMLAAHKGKMDAVMYFINCGVDVNDIALCGSSALFFACQSGHMNVIRFLISQGAKYFPNFEGKTPLSIAAECAREVVVLFLLHDDDSRLNPTLEDVINAYELLGASFACDKDNFDLEKAFLYFEKAMKLRFSTPEPLRKPDVALIPAYRNWVESQSLEELEARKFDRDALYMEALTIRERILGSSSLSVANGAVFRGAVYADHTRFDLCIQLWLHAIRIRKNVLAPVAKDVKRFIELFNRLLLGTANGEKDISLDVILEVLQAATYETYHVLQGSWENCYFDDHLESCYLLLAQISRLLLEKEPSAMIYEVKRVVFNLIKLDARTSTGKTLLHLAMCKSDEVLSRTIPICRCPDNNLVSLLLECGADVNAVDSMKNTPLHLLVSYPRPIRQTLRVISVVQLMIEKGAHIDALNALGYSPRNCEMAATFFGRIGPSNLKCLAAAAAAPFLASRPLGEVPVTLMEFSELHYPKMFCGVSS